MRLRNPNPDEPNDDSPDLWPEPEPEEEPPPYPGLEPGGSATFRVRPGVITAKFAVAVAFALLALTFGVGPAFVIGMIGAAAVGVYGLRDLIGRVRLHADADGLRIANGFGGHRTLAWSDVERLRVDERSRLGTHTELLEVDAGEQLYLLSRFDLGTAPSYALALLEAVRPSEPGR